MMTVNRQKIETPQWTPPDTYIHVQSVEPKLIKRVWLGAAIFFGLLAVEGGIIIYQNHKIIDLLNTILASKLEK